MTDCTWMFHTINTDGEVYGYNYPDRSRGETETTQAVDPCAVVTDAAKADSFTFTRAVAAMVTGHCGDAYTPVWLGQGWTVEIRSGYPLWRTNG